VTLNVILFLFLNVTRLIYCDIIYSDTSDY